MKKIVLLLLILGASLSSNAQNKVELFLNVDVGGGNVLGDVKNSWPIRQDGNAYYGYYSNYSYITERISASAFQRYFSVKPEFRFSERFSLYTGLRLTEFRSSFGSVGSDEHYFFLRPNDDDMQTTEFFRLKSLRESNFYLSIPLEARITIVRPQVWGGFRVYAKVGADVGILLGSKAKIDFLEHEMQQYEKEVIKQVNVSPNKLLSNFYFGMGLGYEISNGWALNLDIPQFSRLLTENNSTLVNTNSFSGVQFTVTAPLNFSKKQKQDSHF